MKLWQTTSAKAEHSSDQENYMGKTIKDDISFLESLIQIHEEARNNNAIDTDLNRILIQKYNNYTGEEIDPLHNSSELQTLKLLVETDSISLGNLLGMNQTDSGARELLKIISEKLKRIAISWLLGNGAYIECLDYLAEQIEELGTGYKKYIFNEVYAILSRGSVDVIEEQWIDEMALITLQINTIYLNTRKMLETSRDSTVTTVYLKKYFRELKSVFINGKGGCRVINTNIKARKIYNAIKKIDPGYIQNNERGNNKSDKIAICTQRGRDAKKVKEIMLEISSELNLRLWDIHTESLERGNDNWDIALITNEDLKRKGLNMRGIQCVRRPESIIYSAAIDHQIANKRWLDVPLEKFDYNTYEALTEAKTSRLLNSSDIDLKTKQEIISNYKASPDTLNRFKSEFEFNGKSYREMISSFGSLEERICFEMQGFSMGTISNMLNCSDIGFYILQVEGIDENSRMGELEHAFQYIGIRDKKLVTCMNLCMRRIAEPEHGHKSDYYEVTKMGNEWEAIFKGELKRHIWRDLAMQVNSLDTMNKFRYKNTI